MLFPRTPAFILTVLLVAPATVQADGVIVPNLGANFGGDTRSELSKRLDAGRRNWGVSFAQMGEGIFGLEADLGFNPDYLGKTELGGSGLLSLMGNVLVGVPLGGQKGAGIRPYGVVGIGLLRATTDALGRESLFYTTEFEDNEAGFDFGGGVMLFFATQLGQRIDVRYLRSFNDLDVIDIPFAQRARPEKIDFVRSSVGAIFRF